MINQINQWFTDATPQPTNRDLTVQTAVMFEEFREFMESIEMDSAYGDVARNEVVDLLFHLETEMKHGSLNIGHMDRKPALDALCDIPVTCVGVANYARMQYPGALQEVANSNDSKRVDGKLLKDTHGKITKGPDYFEPNLEPYL